MSNARGNILARLRETQPDVFAAPERDHISRFDWTKEEKVKRLTERLTAVRAEVHQASSDSWLDKVVEVCQSKGVKNLLATPNTSYGEKLYADKARLPELLAYDESVEAWKEKLFWQVDASFTTTRCGIAETGTLVVWSDVDQPRLMSLVPPIHIAVLELDKLYSTFAEVVTEEGWAKQGMPTNALLISGPSKSADIEQTLAYGVHGPKELVVILV